MSRYVMDRPSFARELGLLLVALLLLVAPSLVLAADAFDVAAGVDAASARYQAMGQFVVARAERAADASSARYQAQADAYDPAGAASGARWAALGAYWSGSTAGSEADAARYRAMGQFYAEKAEAAAAASSARYNALGAHYAQRAEAAASASSARYNALGAYYAACEEDVQLVCYIPGSSGQ
jgi:hypothetical protein